MRSQSYAFRQRDLPAFAANLARTFKPGQRAIKRLVGQPEFGGQIFQRAAQFDCPAVRTDIEREKMPHSVRCRADIPLLDASAKVHHQTGKRTGERLGGLRVFLKGSQ